MPGTQQAGFQPPGKGRAFLPLHEHGKDRPDMSF